MPMRMPDTKNPPRFIIEVESLLDTILLANGIHNVYGMLLIDTLVVLRR